MGAAAGHTPARLQHWLDLMRAGDGEARHELVHHACERLRRLTRRMLRGYPLVRRWDQTDDVLQNALLRLHRALADTTPDGLRHFYNLAALQIRRELLDLAKRHARPDRRTDREDGGEEALAEVPQAGGDEPSTLLEWAEFNRAVEALPDDQREVVNLLWYEDLTQAEAAEVLGVSERTVMRRWQAARIRLYRALHGGLPGDGRVCDGQV